MRDRDRRVTLQAQRGEWFTDQLRAVDDHHRFPCEADTVKIQHTDNSGGRTRAQPLAPRPQAPDVDNVQAVDIFVRVNRLQNHRLAHRAAFGERQLHQYAVRQRISVQPRDQLEQRGFAGVAGQFGQRALQADFFGASRLHARVRHARRIIPEAHDVEMRLDLEQREFALSAVE